MVAQRLTEGAQGDNRLNDVAWLIGVRAQYVEAMVGSILY